MRTETILKIYNTSVLPTFLYGSENWTLTASQRWRIEAAEMKLLRPLAGCSLYDRLVCKELNWESCWQPSGSIRRGNKVCVLFIPFCTWRRQSSSKHTTDTASYTWREESSSAPLRTSNVPRFVYLVVEWVAVHTVGVVCLCSIVKGWHVASRSYQQTAANQPLCLWYYW